MQVEGASDTSRECESTSCDESKRRDRFPPIESLHVFLNNEALTTPSEAVNNQPPVKDFP
jgi:hypothetical protein